MCSFYLLLCPFYPLSFHFTTTFTLIFIPLTHFPFQQPAWLPTVLHNARPLVTLTIREEVRALQYDSDDISDVVEAHGQVMCKAELNGVNDVTLSFSGAAAVADVRVHACAQAEEDFDASSAVVFSPPLEVFPLLSYRIPSIPKPPVRGFYQMKVRKIGIKCG